MLGKTGLQCAKFLGSAGEFRSAGAHAAAVLLPHADARAHSSSTDACSADTGPADASATDTATNPEAASGSDASPTNAGPTNTRSDAPSAACSHRAVHRWATVFGAAG
jgi:hypothetical protein